MRESSAPICPQDCYDQYDWVPSCPKLETGGQSEQCLYLHVTSPDRVIDDEGMVAMNEKTGKPEKLPVIVYLHGGSFTFGSGQSALYDARYLSGDGDVVVVDVNYRLGIFGFMPYDGEWEGEPAAGNFGLADQRRALEFVHDYIHLFGGDKDKVTLSGQSAGSESTYLHIMNDGRHLDHFRAGIMMSAPLSIPLVPKDIAISSMQKAVLDESMKTDYQVNCDDFECLKSDENVDTATLLLISHKAQIPGFAASPEGLEYRLTHPLSLFQGYDPIVDGNIVKNDFLALSENRNDLKKPMMIGSVGDEGEGFVQALVPELFNLTADEKLDQYQYKNMLDIIWTASNVNGSGNPLCVLPQYRQQCKKGEEEVDQMLEIYPWDLDCDRYHDKSDPSSCDAKEAANHWVRDYLFVCPQRKMLQNLLGGNAENKQNLPNVYWWYFDQPFPWIPPELNQQYFDSYRRCDEFACHGTDIAFLFGLDKSFPFVQFSEGDRRLARVFMSYVSNFVHNLDPNDSQGRVENEFTKNLEVYNVPEWKPFQSFIEDWSKIGADWGFQYLSGGIEGTSEFRQDPKISLQKTSDVLDLGKACDMFDSFDQYDDH